ncbi:MAG: hypothetical protein DME34_09595, partial [Verrucomicrobia bacterium]
MLARDWSDAVAILAGGRQMVILRVLVVVILGQRGIDEVKDDAGDVDLAIIEKLEGFSDQTCRGMREADDEESGV